MVVGKELYKCHFISTGPVPLKLTILMAPTPSLKSALALPPILFIDFKTSGSASIVSVKTSPHLSHITSKSDVLYIVLASMHVPLVFSILAVSFPTFTHVLIHTLMMSFNGC